MAVKTRSSKTSKRERKSSQKVKLSELQKVLMGKGALVRVKKI